MLVRLLTENKNYTTVRGLIYEQFQGFTIIKAEGLWQGTSEHSLIIEIDLPTLDRPEQQKIEQLVYAIKQLNKQDKVLVQYIESESKLL